ncbi:MAG TPA: glycosyl hydrolase [Pelobium sp.]|nr:glycosyl hydrolase [Pelobium sp.]
MKSLKNVLIFIVAGITVISCKKKESVQLNLVVPPVVTPPSNSGNTVLKVSLGLNQANPSVDLDAWVVYSSSTQNSGDFKPLPAGYDDKIKSFLLPKGYMAVFAENQNGTGESICYVAAVNDISANLPARLVDKVSFVRFVPVRNVDKKGVCNVTPGDVNALQGAWFYNWGLGSVSTDAMQYVPMTWGKNAGSTANALTFIGRRDIDHVLSFNEPDNKNQANITNIDEAVTNYKFILQAGLRMCSPAVEQDASTGATRWLPQFVSAANAQKARIDVMALHWYDWGNQTVNQATDQLTAAAILNRFKAYVTKLHAAYPDQTLWFTEYNCNPARSEAVHILFMKASAAYLNTLPYVERYAYFFPAVHPPTSGAPNFTLTPMGQTWFDIKSVPSFSANIIPK